MSATAIVASAISADVNVPSVISLVVNDPEYVRSPVLTLTAIGRIRESATAQVAITYGTFATVVGDAIVDGAVVVNAEPLVWARIF
jgi:hypothetical protein